MGRHGFHDDGATVLGNTPHVLQITQIDNIAGLIQALFEHRNQGHAASQVASVIRRSMFGYGLIR